MNNETARHLKAHFILSAFRNP